MAIGDKIKLISSALVAGGFNDVVHYTPADGEKLLIYKFAGTGNNSSLADVQLVWDSSGTPDILWVLDWGPMPDDVFFERTGDGIKKLTLCLSNGCTNGYHMSGFSELEVMP
jgi:hypothetical protein